jgi:hypothetical protein
MTMSIKKRSLYVYSWQQARVNLDFSTVSSTLASIRTCERYLEKHGKTPANLFKVVNLYAATAMGLNGQLQRKQSMLQRNNLSDNNGTRDLKERLLLVKAFREPLSELYALCEDDLASFQVHDIERKQELAKASLQSVLEIHKSLRARWISSHKRDYEVQRDELSEYLEMLENELRYRRVNFTSAFRQGASNNG